MSAVKYRKVAKKLLYQFKYKPYLSDLQTIITDLLYENLVQSEIFDAILKTSPLLIPIPLSKSKLRSRGYNQSEILAKNIGKRFGLEVANCLVRIKETKPQYGLKREERMENMRDAFGMRINSDKFRSSDKIQKNSFRQPQTIKTALLIDDVVTTGSTLREAANILKRNGFEKVYGVTFAQD